MPYKLGWKPDLPDHRDHQFKLSKRAVVPVKVDLRPQMPPVYDQGELGSCTANGVGACLEFSEMKEKHPVWTPSRLFIYYGERVLEGTVSEDSGAQIRDGIKVVNAKGVCKEDTWPYDVSKFAVAPPTKAYAEAYHYKALTYTSLDNTKLTQLKAGLAAGYPVVFGFTVYDSFMSNEVANTGIVPLPGLDEQVQGGHCVVAVGYDDSKHMFIVRNSWGTGWGQNGYCFMPYAYLTNANLADDFWQIKTVS